MVLLAWGEDIGEVLREELADLGDFGKACRVGVRLLVAIVLGGLLGYEREHVHKPAGLRTHMLVALGAALFTAVPLLAGMDSAAISRVIQGLATGIGFLGGGAILKLADEKTIHGLTSAASIWLATAVGVAAGVGRFWAALFGTLGALVVLSLLGRIEQRVKRNTQQGETRNHP